MRDIPGTITEYGIEDRLWAERAEEIRRLYICVSVDAETGNEPVSHYDPTFDRELAAQMVDNGNVSSYARENKRVFKLFQLSEVKLDLL